MMNNMPYQMPAYIPYENQTTKKIFTLEEKVHNLEQKQNILEQRLNKLENKKPDFLSSNVSTENGLYMI